MAPYREAQIEAAQDFHRHEMDVGDGDWERWVAACEAILGHDLDGGQARDGYSLDEALEWFEAGNTPAEYADAVRAA